jgi:hypothetical protein
MLEQGKIWRTGVHPLFGGQVKKKKSWEAVAAGLRTSDDRVATFEGVPIVTSAGPCFAHSVAGGDIR